MAAHNPYTANDYRHFNRIPIKRALISVSDKTGLLDLAKALHEAGVALRRECAAAAVVLDRGQVVADAGVVLGDAVERGDRQREAQHLL